MGSKDCKACSDLQEYCADFVANDVTENVCNSLKNNTGMNPSSGHDDCTDLHNANDCLVGNMEDMVDAYQVCDWKEFTASLIHNIWKVLKAMICAICGLWKITEKTSCETETLLSGQAFTIGESTSDESYIVAGQGVSFLTVNANGNTIRDIAFTYIGGALCRLNGSIWLYHTNNFTDPRSCYSFDEDGVNPTYSASRKKNTNFNGTQFYDAPGELLYEIRIKKSQYPMIRQLYAGIAAPTGAGAYQVNLTWHDEGDECDGQRATSPKHYVPAGYIYVQARLLNIMHAFPDGQKYTPRGFMGIRLNQNAIECE